MKQPLEIHLPAKPTRLGNRHDCSFQDRLELLYILSLTVARSFAPKEQRWCFGGPSSACCSVSYGYLQFMVSGFFSLLGWISWVCADMNYTVVCETENGYIFRIAFMNCSTIQVLNPNKRTTGTKVYTLLGESTDFTNPTEFTIISFLFNSCPSGKQDPTKMTMYDKRHQGTFVFSLFLRLWKSLIPLCTSSVSNNIIYWILCSYRKRQKDGEVNTQNANLEPKKDEN